MEKHISISIGNTDSFQGVLEIRHDGVKEQKWKWSISTNGRHEATAQDMIDTLNETIRQIEKMQRAIEAE